MYNIDIKKEVINRLVALRKSGHFTQEQIAQKIGFSRRYINKLENGHSKNIKLMTVLNYLDACNIDWADFFNDLSRYFSNQRYEQMIREIDFPKDEKIRRKIERDVAYYHSKIQGTKGKAKPLSFQEQHKAVVKFGNYRSKIETIESLAYKIIATHIPSTTLNPFYKAFVREIYKTIKKNYSSQLPLDRGFEEIIKRWVKRGLSEDILLKIKDTIMTHFKIEPIERNFTNILTRK